MVGPLGLLMMVTTQNLMASLVHVALSICPLLEQRPHMNDIETGLLRALCNRDTEICVSKGAPFPFILGTLLLTLSQSCDTLWNMSRLCLDGMEFWEFVQHLTHNFDD